MNNNVLAIIVAFYLSKYDKDGLRNLGFTSFNEAFVQTATLLGVKRNYVKLRRDEFDPVFPWREGWKRPMDRRIIRAIEILDELEEIDLRDIIRNILHNPPYREEEYIKEIVDIIKNTTKSKLEVGKFILRCPTGKAAEEYFYNYYESNKEPVAGTLMDCRDLGCGYDYKIVDSAAKEIYVEVKGLSDLAGGVLFTRKEWEMAMRHGNSYFLCVVKNVNSQPELEFIRNPSQSLNPTKNVRTVLQVSWSVSDRELKTALKNSTGI